MNRLLPRPMFQPSQPESYLFDEFDRLREQLLGGLPLLRTHGEWAPALAALEEHEDAFTIEVEVPGFDRDGIDIELEGRRLLVHAEREDEQRSGVLRSSTRSSRQLHHEVLLPTEVTEDGIEASLDRGVLHIRLPKAEQSGRHRIEIG